LTQILLGEEPMLNKNLRVITVTLLNSRGPGKTLSEISNDTKLPLPWLKSFSKQGMKSDARSDRVVTLYEYLSKRTLI